MHSNSHLKERISTRYHNTAIQGRAHINITHAHTGCHNVTYSEHGVAHESTSHLNHTRIKECLRDTETLTAKVLHNIANYKNKQFKIKSSTAEIQRILPMTNMNKHTSEKYRWTENERKHTYNWSYWCRHKYVSVWIAGCKALVINIQSFTYTIVDDRINPKKGTLLSVTMYHQSHSMWTDFDNDIYNKVLYKLYTTTNTQGGI